MIKFQIKAGILLIFLQLFCKPIFPAEYYVNNANEIRAAMNNAQPGDTLTMTNVVWTDQEIVFQGSGMEGAPIILRVETPGYVIINGKSNLRIADDYLAVDGLRFVGGYSPSGAVVEFRNGGLQSNHSRMTNCSIVEYNYFERCNGEIEIIHLPNNY